MICNSSKCKEIIFRKKVLFRILRKLITFRNARSYRLRSHGYTKRLQIRVNKDVPSPHLEKKQTINP